MDTMILIEKIRNPAVLARLLLPFLLVAFSGVSPRPHLADKSLRQAWLYMQSENNRMTVQYLQVAAELLPHYPGLWEWAGQYAVRAGDSKLALECLHQAELRGDLSLGGKIAFGEAYQISGDLARAIEIWQNLPPSSETLTRLLIAHQTTHDLPAQIEDLKSLILLQPDKAEYYYRLGLLMAATQPETAPVYLLQASERDAQYYPAYQSLSDAIHEALAAGDMTYLYLSAGRVLASLQEWHLAEVAFEYAANKDPDYAEAWAFLGEARQHTSDTEAATQLALENLTKAWELDPNSIAANTFLALYWQRQQKFDLALVYIQSAVKLDYTNPVLQVEMGHIQVKLGDLPVAQACYERAIELAPQVATYYRILAEFSLSNQIQIRQIALPAARQAVIVDPQNPLNLDLLGQSYQGLEDYSLAERFFQQALQLDPQSAAVHLHLGQNHLYRGNLAEARQELLLVLGLAPNSEYADQAQKLLKRYFP